MISFHGKQEVKDEYVARVLAHEKADEIIHGIGWENGKGCAVGCTMHAYDHSAYEREIGVPRILARLEDRIFEGMGNGEAKTFPRRLLEAIPVGADLSMVWPKFAVWLLVDPEHGVIRFTKKDSKQWVAIHRVADLYRELKDWDKRDRAAFRNAAAYADAARAAADAARAAAYADAAYAYADAAAYAADAAADAAAARAAADAARAAAYADAARAAADADAYADAAAARAAAYAADAAADAAAYADAYAARRKTHKAQADKLIELLRSAT